MSGSHQPLNEEKHLVGREKWEQKASGGEYCYVEIELVIFMMFSFLERKKNLQRPAPCLEELVSYLEFYLQLQL